jgi:DEAD/DEAH box helicase domain-containing protein
MDVEAFLESVKRDPSYAGQIVHVHREPAREPVWVPPSDGLNPLVKDFLCALGVGRLYRHQADAISAAISGEDIIVTTSSASGKSLCYQVPVLEGLLDDPDSTALLVFPTKALARDQMAAWNTGVCALKRVGDPRELMAVPFDADAGTSTRRSARESARVLVTNPEMIHMSMLPGHGRWQRFFKGLRFVVLDEAHIYAGFFGANMANVLRRVDRVCAHYRSRPQFFCLSATLGNPVEMAERITGRKLHHVSDDSSMSGSRTYVLWNPPRIKKRKWRGRRSANVEAHELMVMLIRQRITTICFSKARNTAEMVYRYVRETLQGEAPALADRVVPYRGGYTPAERREMERRLREGELLGVSATRALELGIDVGCLDAAIVIGYPGTLNAFFQQTGRAGRAGRDCLCILIGVDTPINQYIMHHPEFIFSRPIERAVVDQDNPFVVLGQVRCATAELPLPEDDVEEFGYASGLALDVLEETHKVKNVEHVWYHASGEEPAHDVRLRGYGDESTVIMDIANMKVIDRMDKFRSMRLFYPGCIYFHSGDTYAMVEHDTDRNVVLVRKVEVPYYTDPITGTQVDHVDAIIEQRPLGSGTASLGEVFAVLSTPIYEKVRFYTLDRISQHPTNLPSIAYEAMSFWLTPPESLVQQVARIGLSAESGMKGILYCVSRILPLFLTSDTNDFDWTLGCRNSPWHTMFWFEFYLHGIGQAEQCFERLEEILEIALEHLLTCDCDDGCPNCTSRLITPYHVRNIELGEGTVHSRRAAIVILNSLLRGQSVEDSIKVADEPRARRGMQFLPTFTEVNRRAEPNRMPLDERTRALMLRKIERDRFPKLPVDHAIDPNPRVGMPAPESAESLPKTDAERRSGRDRLRRGEASAEARQLRRRLDQVSRAAVKPAESAEPGSPAPLIEKPPEMLQPPAIKAGDDIARRARRLKRRD